MRLAIGSLQREQPIFCPVEIRSIRREPLFVHAAQQEMALQISVAKAHAERGKLGGIDRRAHFFDQVPSCLGRPLLVLSATNQHFRKIADPVLRGDPRPQIEILLDAEFLAVGKIPQNRCSGHARGVLEHRSKEPLRPELLRRNGFAFDSFKRPTILAHPADPGAHGRIIGMAIEERDLLR